jgi:hypothetical protein
MAEQINPHMTSNSTAEHLSSAITIPSTDVLTKE